MQPIKPKGIMVTVTTPDGLALAQAICTIREETEKDAADAVMDVLADYCVTFERVD